MPRPPFSPAEIKALLSTCNRRGFEDRRDLAIMRLFLDTGVRVPGMAGLRYHRTDPDACDLRLMENKVRVTLKGGDELWVPLGTTATAALDRYVRARARHPYADSSWLWLGVTARGAGHLSANGINQIEPPLVW